MKKTFKLLVMLCAAMIAIFAITACDKNDGGNEHTHTAKKVEAVAATCTSVGCKEYWTCTDCDEIFSDEKCKNEVTLEELEIPALPHIPAEDDGDCTTATLCTECDAVITEAKANHTPTEDDGDCTTAILCTECGKVTLDAKDEHVDTNIDGKCDFCEYKLDYVYDEENNTYIVFTAEGLYAWANDSWKGVNLLLANDIVMPSELRFDIDGDGTNDSNWKPQRVSTTVDGNGYSIKGLVIKSNLDGASGSFIYMLHSSGVVKNLRIVDADMSFVGINYAILVGYNDGLIENCGVSGRLYVEGNNVGGIVGTNTGKIIGCYNDAEITATVGGAGGIVGQNAASGDIIACYNTGAIISEDSANGGIVGSLFGGSVIASYSTSEVYGSFNYGAIAGYRDREDGVLVSDYWSTFGDSPEYGVGNSRSNENAQKVDGTELTWSAAMAAMNAALESGEYEWRYAINTGDDAEIRPLILVRADSAE